MKHARFLVLTLIIMIAGCSVKTENPLLSDFNTPLGTPPFNLIKTEHYLPALEHGMKVEIQEIEALVKNPEAPSFENTIVALDNTGILLGRVRNIFDNMNSANTNDSLQEISRKVAPLLSRHNDDILLNEKLFQRIKAVYEQKDALNLNEEQQRLLDLTWRTFVRGGANLNPADKEQLRKINEELSVLGLKFGENVLKETNRFEMVLEKPEELAGLPANVLTAAAEAAKESGKDGKWLFTIRKPSLIPFLQYSERRDLREKMFLAYINQGNHNDDLDNKELAAKMAALRVQRAKILGYKTHADFVLEENMAKTPDKVYELLNKLWTPALARAKKEAADLQKMVNQDGQNFKLEPWDWWFYAEKVKKANYDLNDEILRPYFKLENVIQGVFDVAGKLWGLKFEERTDIPKYHDDVKVFEVKEADGTHIGILYTDYFPRASKRGGAWMSSFRDQYRLKGQDITPIIINVGNFTKPTADQPSLLTFEEVSTLFHEFGHGLHGLLSNVTYSALSGTSVPRDFVELPSTMMENWASDSEVLKMYARHYQTNEPIPDELIAKIEHAKLFNQGFETVEYLAASFLDMDWHILAEPFAGDVLTFEKNSLDKIGLMPEIVTRYRSSYFRHIFSGDYSSGYYSYIWSEWLDADAFAAFKEKSVFDLTLAQAYRKNILSAGGTADPMELYKRFRGAEPKIEPLLKRRGLDRL